MVECKLCTKCKENKPTSDFSKRKRVKSGLTPWCKKCVNYHAKHREKSEDEKLRNLESGRRYRRKFPFRSRERRWQEQGINLTYKGFNKKFAKQKGCCAICGRHQSEFKNSLNVDLNHETGKIRDLLCITCNHLVGYIETRKETVENVKIYLTKWNE